MKLNWNKLRALCFLASFGVEAIACTTQDPNVALCNAHAQHLSHQEESATGTLTRILRESHGRYGPHAQFLITLNSSCALTLRIATNEHFTGPLPLRVGQTVQVRGEYEYSRRGGVLHWTHRDPRGHRDSGFVIIDGHLYE